MTEAEQKVLESLMKIQSDVSGIKEHLKALNGRVVTNMRNIEKNRCSIDKNDKTLAKMLGGLAVITIAVNFFVYKILN